MSTDIITAGQASSAADGRDRSQEKRRYYAVAGGPVPGIYKHWADVEPLIKGSIVKHKKFGTKSEARAYLMQNKDVIERSRIQREASATAMAQQPRHLARSETSHSSPRATLPSQISRTLISGKEYIATASMNHQTGRRSKSPRFTSEPGSTTLIEPMHPRSSPPSYSQLPDVREAIMMPEVIRPPELVVDPDPILSSEQQRVVDLILAGNNVFYTGSAGCGKSTVLKAFVKKLQSRNQKVRIVAPTNLAALNVNGQTTW